MSEYFETEDYEVGYRKPPVSGQFQKGASGNPSGRPKKAPDFESQVLREFNSKLVITEHGKRKVITKRDGLAKQLLNKAVTGHLPSARFLVPYYKQALENLAEQQRKSAPKTELDIRNLTDAELWALMRSEAEKSVRPELEKSIRAKLKRSIRAELEKSMRARLEKSIRAELEKSIRGGQMAGS